MLNRTFLSTLFLSSTIVLAQTGSTATGLSSLQAPTTLPIAFTNTVSADHSHTGDRVLARTEQAVHLANGGVIPSGTTIVGHVVAANPFVYDKTPYAQQKPSTLSIRFDSLQVAGMTLPLNITVRAMADPLSSWSAREPGPSDMDPAETTTQIGGDELIRWKAEVVSRDGDVVAYNKRDGVYAHLVANHGCDASSVEVSVGIYSASACGLYGFTDVTAQETGSAANPSVLTLASTHTSPKVWKHSTALLEVLPTQQTVASR
jgi:hypothetical protein